MTTIDDVFLVRWNLMHKGITYNADWGIPTFWRAHPELGSPLGPETDIGNGQTAQAFTGGVVIWNPATGGSIATG